MSSPLLDHVSPGVHAHYRDFYDGIGATRAPVLVVLGNCQAESLRLMIDGGDVRTVRIPAVHELVAADLDPLHRLLARTDLLVAQPVGPDYRGLPLGTAQVVERLPPGARHALVPSIRYAGLHPFHVLVHPPGGLVGEPPVVPYHDLRTVVAAAWDRAGRPAPPAPDLTPEAVRAVAEASIAELVRREQRNDTVVVSDVLTSLAPGLGFDLVRTINHPGNEVLVEVAARLRTRLGLEPAAPGVDRPLLNALHAPRDPVVASMVGVAARSSWLVDGLEVAAEEVARAHLAWYAAHPLALDAALQRSTPTRSLLGLEAPA